METQGAPSAAVPNPDGDALEENSGVVSVRDIALHVEPAPVTGPSVAAPRHEPGPRFRDALQRRWRKLAVVVVAVACFGAWRALAGAARAPTLEQALARHVQSRGLSVDPAQVVWLTAEPNWLGVRSALFTAKRERELRDIYYADVRVSGSSVLDVYSLTNTTRTSSADEDTLVGNRQFAAYAARVGDAYDALVVVDSAGESLELTRSWPWYAKLQNAITNYQDTGRTRAFGQRRYVFAGPVTKLQLATSSGLLHAEVDGSSIVIAPRRELPLIGAELVKVERAQKGQPGTITWLVDTVRRVPAIGRAPIDWLEHEVFGLTDRATRAYHEFVKTDTAAEVKQALVVPELPKARSAASPAPTPLVEPEVVEDIGWPPAPIAPELSEKVQGEGAWLPVAQDAFAPINPNPNGPPLFYQTFIRVDPERAYTRVYVTMWDPRQVQLGIVMGTKEPESATGDTGNGLIPRDPYVLSHLVGGFNGGFQAMHGEFGMMASKRVYLPPKPFAATVAVFEDGTTGMGSWPGPGRHAWDESFANSQIPGDMLAMRQNLTSVVEGTKYNPWERWWWGAAPEWAAEQTYIHRSGLCMTREGFLAYFWGESMGPAELGKAMLAARCDRGMHLDMNGKHTGFEFYQTYGKQQLVPTLDRALRPSEFEGVLSGDTSGLRLRARLAVTTMTPLRFPRYVGQDPRDYFYLTRRPTLPGPEVQQPGGKVLGFSTRGLPSAGFPHAFARAHVEGAGWIARVDLARAVPKGLAHTSLTRTIGAITSATTAGQAPQQALWAHYQYGSLRAQVGSPAPGSTTLVAGPLVSELPNARAGVGVDAEGFLVYAEATHEGALAELLQLAGVARAIALGDGQLVLNDDDGSRTLDGRSVEMVEESTSLLLMAETRPAARVLFDDVVPTPYRKWGGMQDQRVRYFPSHPARFQAPENVH